MARIVRTLVMQPQLVAVAHPKCRFRIALFLSRFPRLCLTVHLESVSSHVANKARNGHAQLRQDLHFLQTRRLFLFLLTRSTSLTHTHTLSLMLSLSLLLTLVCKNARLLLTFSILCTRMRPLFGLPSFSEDIISSSLSSFMPSARSVNRSSTSILACD